MRDFLAELKAIINKVDNVRTKKAYKTFENEDFERYQIIKFDGNERRVIAWGMPKNEAAIFLRKLHEKVLKINNPNNDGLPYFKAELYQAARVKEV